VNSEENRSKCWKFLDGKPLVISLFGMYYVKVKELEAVLKVNAQAGQSGTLNKNSLESTAQDDFQEVMRPSHVSLMISQREPRSRRVPIPTAVKEPSKSVPNRNFFTPLRTNDMDTKTSGTENTTGAESSHRNK
jgi:hypothetical protein